MINDIVLNLIDEYIGGNVHHYNYLSLYKKFINETKGVEKLFSRLDRLAFTKFILMFAFARNN